jgi:hypothetical protein
MANSFKFNNASKTISYARGKFTLPFTSRFTSKVFFSYSDSSVINNAQINKDQTEVTFQTLTEGVSSTRTLGLSARTTPDYNVDAIFEQTGGTQQIVNQYQASHIEYAEADGVEVVINSQGQISWNSSSSYHSVFLKFENGYDGYNLFNGVQGIKSCRVGNVEEIGDSMFDSSSIEECMFCDGVKILGDDTFLFATNFINVWLPQTLEEIGNRNFARTNLSLINCYFQHRIEYGELNFDGIGSTIDMYWLDDGSDLGQDWYYEFLDGGATTINIYQLDFPEEGNEYDCYLIYYTGPVEDMDYYNQYLLHRIFQLTASIAIYQSPTKIYLEKNICEPITITIPSNDQEYISYKVFANNEEIFDGKILSSGDETTIKLNQVVEKHIVTDFNIPQKNKAERFYNYNLFEIKYSYDDFITTNTLDGVIKVYNDWTYESGLKRVITNQIEKEICVYQPIVECFELHKGESGTVAIVVERENGTNRTITSQTFEQCSFIVHASAQNTDYSLKVTAMKITLTVNGNTTEHRYAVKRANGEPIDAQMRMYARNKMGGFDSISFNRTSKESDSFTISNYVTDSDTSNSVITNQYQKDITHTWQCKTNWISEKNSKLVQDLFASTQAYLQTTEHFTNTNFNSNIIPINITTSKAERKYYFANGRKFNQYVFDLEEKEKNKFI